MTLLTAALLYAFLSLDQVAVGPFLLSRPVVTGAIIGGVLGNGPLGFLAGLTVELLSLPKAPAGLTSPDMSIVAALGVAWTLQGPSLREGLLPLSLALAFPAGLLMRRVDVWVLRQNDRFNGWVVGRLIEGRERVLWKALAAWAALWVVKGVAAFLLLAWAGAWAVDLLWSHLPLPVLEGLDRAARLLPVAGFAAAAHYFWTRAAGRAPGKASS